MASLGHNELIHNEFLTLIISVTGNINSQAHYKVHFNIKTVIPDSRYNQVLLKHGSI